MGMGAELRLVVGPQIPLVARWLVFWSTSNSAMTLESGHLGSSWMWSLVWMGVCARSYSVTGGLNSSKSTRLGGLWCFLAFFPLAWSGLLPFVFDRVPISTPQPVPWTAWPTTPTS